MLRLRQFLALSGNAGGRFNARPIVNHFSTFGTDLHRLQRRCDRLMQLQRKIRFPQLETITVNGEAVQLPLSAVEPVRTPSQEELEYLVGFFDGDGCVSMKKETGEVQLAISQNIDAVEVLLRFRSFLGGGVSRHSASTGSQKATLRWQIWGSKMSAAAETLSRIPSMKQAQLLIATKARSDIAMSERARLAERLKMFKQKQHMPDTGAVCAWSYFAGLFDAEGNIYVSPTSTSLRLEVKQVNPCILVRLLPFLGENRLQGWNLRHNAMYSVLVCSNLRDCKQTLELLLAHGLLVKQKQATLALSLSAENHLQVRDAISSLNGLQGRYKRLDADSIGRAREIHRLQQRLHRLSGPERATMLSHLEELRGEHNLQKLISRCDLLRRDMRQSLREGGSVALANGPGSS